MKSQTLKGMSHPDAPFIHLLLSTHSVESAWDQGNQSTVLNSKLTPNRADDAMPEGSTG